MNEGQFVLLMKWIGCILGYNRVINCQTKKKCLIHGKFSHIYVVEMRVALEMSASFHPIAHPFSLSLSLLHIPPFVFLLTNDTNHSFVSG